MAGRSSEKLPWVPLIILLVGIIIFWVVPATQSNPKVTALPAPSSTK